MTGIAITFSLTAAGTLAGLFRPYIGLLIYVAFAIIKPPAMYWAVPPYPYSKIIAISLLIGWAINGFGRWNFGKARPIVWSLVGFWVCVLFSSLVAPNTTIAFNQAIALSKIFLPFVVGASLIDSEKKLMTLAWVIIVCQGYIAFDLNWMYLNGDFHANTTKYIGLDNNVHAIMACAAIGLPFFFMFYYRNPAIKLLLVFISACMAHFILLSMSRGGMLGLGIVGVIAFFVTKKNWRHYAAFAAAAAVVAYLAGPSVQEEFATIFTQGDTPTEASRVDYWKICAAMAADHPVTGVGLDHFPILIVDYGTRMGFVGRGYQAGKEAHSLWFQTAAELGVPGIVFLLSFYGFCVVRSIRLGRGKIPGSSELSRTMANCVFASLVAFMASASFVTVEGIEIPYYVALLGTCNLKLATTRRSLPAFNTEPSTRSVPVQPPPPPVGVASPV